ncbi:hypothetical protein FF124_07595 [Martelella lutilitoris]|uniref:Uncharacterized protein n=1 Tax=Martelella lutilitoris TaxID=2583532 RepID=A0A5C4JSJ3_9HYPH|nr:hypothetical protein [Martelella lutilitoris]TNB48192.1 hypothetical protein FF124_07595 [Martelella lutilitoris]
MAARNENFPWTSHYGHYRYFEGQMNRHGKVASLISQGDGLYELTRTQGDRLRVFICECYAFGVAEYIETVDRIGEINVIVINSMWCGYTPDAKSYCRESKVGLFKVGEFMGALHHTDYWLYLTEEEKEYFEKHG